MNTIKRVSISVVSALTFTLLGCANYDKLSQSECVNADWNAVGFDISRKGFKANAIDNFQASCGKHGIEPDVVAFNDGYSKGLTIYCTNSNGYELGKKNEKYRNICPDSLEWEFKQGYSAGKSEYRQNETLKKQKFNRRWDI